MRRSLALVALNRRIALTLLGEISSKRGCDTLGRLDNRLQQECKNQHH